MDPDAVRSVFLPDKERCLNYLRRVRFKGWTQMLLLRFL
ncbi:hypothetical protein HRbin02_00703 [Candidatus Calditenuaceae archaeon HR02]|nr:hypothetical protein HRbin02_00703 [Candidatus Calditenuaceae archaeon HR02]